MRVIVDLSVIAGMSTTSVDDDDGDDDDDDIDDMHTGFIVRSDGAACVSTV